MRARLTRFFVASLVALSASQLAAQSGQEEQGTIFPGWLQCNQCLTPQELQQAAEKAKTVKLAGPRDLSGVWGRGGNGFNLNNKIPEMTALGKEKYAANKPGLGRRGVPLGNDPLMICDPLGYPRSFTYNYGMEFIEQPGRVLQFFEYDHVWRTIYTDGRKLPTGVDPRWYGYAVGRWEGDTFVIESAGFDDRTWIDADGHPHSDQMRLVERYRRTGPDTMSASMTINDPLMYTAPWVTETTLRLNPAAEFGEQFCSPSEEAAYKELMRDPAGGAARAR